MMRSCLALLTGAALYAGAAAATTPDIHSFELDNGMKVIVKPDERAPVVINQVWFPVGSSHEQPGTTGVAHALEHMMFKGTETRETGTFSRTISEEGGQLNAFTGRDFTGYYEELGADRLEIAMELEADRLENIVFDQDEFEREMEVVQEERRLRVDDNPMGVLRERFNAVAWHHSPYRQPIIGWKRDIDQLTLDDIEAFYDDWYGVNNAILVVVGNVDPDEVRALADKHFGPLEPRPTPDIKDREEVEPLGERRLTVHHDNANPFLMMGYHVPSLATTDDPGETYALSVLSQVLDGGRSARLPTELVRGQELAAGIGTSYRSMARLDTHFAIHARPTGEVELDELEEAVRAEVERVREDGITTEELERAKVQLRADYVYRLDSLSGQAMEIGLLETTGIGYQAMEEFEERLEAVSREDVQEVAQRYLQDKRLTVGHLLRSEDADDTPTLPGMTPGADATDDTTGY
ncbi:pitrilysin family protein [Aquisalimonas sp. 2447]|uniref:M16 family metallopeptidase n=1 Tax=Aquisalimonas sp. 2447 TaxID=2740807 RepID=UPI0020C2ABBB|nr:pitrilysin family protein [Aquisalimonas sp. 2447]